MRELFVMIDVLRDCAAIQHLTHNRFLNHLLEGTLQKSTFLMRWKREENFVRKMKYNEMTPWAFQSISMQLSAWLFG
jgi:hypothetical protein